MRLAETSRRSGRTVHVFATPKTARSSLPAHFWVPVSRSSRQMIVRGSFGAPYLLSRQRLAGVGGRRLQNCPLKSNLPAQSGRYAERSSFRIGRFAYCV